MPTEPLPNISDTLSNYDKRLYLYYLVKVMPEIPFSILFKNLDSIASYHVDKDSYSCELGCDSDSCYFCYCKICFELKFHQFLNQLKTNENS